MMGETLEHPASDEMIEPNDYAKLKAVPDLPDLPAAPDHAAQTEQQRWRAEGRVLRHDVEDPEAKKYTQAYYTHQTDTAKAEHARDKADRMVDRQVGDLDTSEQEAA